MGETVGQGLIVMVASRTLTESQLKQVAQVAQRTARAFDMDADIGVQLKQYPYAPGRRDLHALTSVFSHALALRQPMTVDFSTRTITVAEQTVTMTRTEAVLLWEIHTTPGGIRTADLATRTGTTIRGVRVFLSRLRSKMGPYGWTVICDPHRGYLFDTDEDTVVIRRITGDEALSA